MTRVETRTKKKAAGAIPRPSKADMKGKIVEYAWWMKKQGYAESTIIGRTRLLRVMVKRGGNLFDPESIKDTIARQEWCNGRKANAVDAYTRLLQMLGMKWDPPSYKRVRKLPFIPTENEIDQLIAGCSNRTATLLQLLKETGIRVGEAWKITWTDLDAENRTVRITPEKGSNPRIFKLSNKLIAMINRLPKGSERMFGTATLKTRRRIFESQRKRIARRLQNPRIQKITFHTLRHFKATMEYHKTKDILHVMKILGHKNISNTLIYTHLIDFQDDEYISRVAKTVAEARQLIEAGFEYVTEMEGLKIFRKRK